MPWECTRNIATTKNSVPTANKPKHPRSFTRILFQDNPPGKKGSRFLSDAICSIFIIVVKL